MLSFWTNRSLRWVHATELWPQPPAKFFLACDSKKLSQRILLSLEFYSEASATRWSSPEGVRVFKRDRQHIIVAAESLDDLVILDSDLTIQKIWVLSKDVSHE